MITRVWHGTTASRDAERYLQFLFETAVPDYRDTPGNLGVEIWKRPDGDICHFWTATKWDSFDDIRRFAGDDLEKAKYYPEDSDFLLEFEEKVMHCETFVF
jgi:heme-degrading monooxygenase HmoA